MSINRDRLARLGVALALVATAMLQGPAAASQATAARGALTNHATTARGALASPASAALSRVDAAPVSLGSSPVAVPGALGAAAAGIAAAGTGSEGVGGPGSGSTATGAAGTGAAGMGSAGTAAAPPQVRAGSVLLADEETGQVLFGRAERQPRAMASTTKVMTALLTLEHLDRRATVVIGTEPTTRPSPRRGRLPRSPSRGHGAPTSPPHAGAGPRSLSRTAGAALAGAGPRCDRVSPHELSPGCLKDSTWLATGHSIEHTFDGRCE